MSCFLEMLVQERSSVTGCLLMMPVRAWGVTVRLMLRSIRDQSRLSKHLQTRARSYRRASSGHRINIDYSRKNIWLRMKTRSSHHLYQFLQTAMQTHRSARLK